MLVDMDAKIEIRFLRDARAPQQLFRTHCECCGPQFEGWEDTFFLKGEELDPDETYHKVDLRGLKLGEDFEIIKFEAKYLPSIF